MSKTEIGDLLAGMDKSKAAYQEFIRSAGLSVGLYHLPAGAHDPQQPHTEDEVYYVISGRGQIRVDDEDMPVQASSTVFVGANVKHHFHSITEDLVVLVVFGPAEYSRQGQRGV